MAGAGPGPCPRTGGVGVSCLGDEPGMKEVQPAGRHFSSYGLGLSICDMGPHQVGVVKGLCPFKAQESVLGRQQRDPRERTHLFDEVGGGGE